MSARIFSCLTLLGLVLILSSCGEGGPPNNVENNDPGNNDLNVVVGFGDSLTSGSECACNPYTRRLAPLIEKSVVNTGVSASLAVNSVERTQEAIDKYHPAFMLILYGVNDVIHGVEVGSILTALDQMLAICEANQVVPVIATYPQPIGPHLGFAERTLLLNDGIRQLAEQHDIFCVDLEYEFNADPELYGADGLHPNDSGTDVMALAFADVF